MRSFERTAATLALVTSAALALSGCVAQPDSEADEAVAAAQSADERLGTGAAACEDQSTAPPCEDQGIAPPPCQDQGAAPPCDQVPAVPAVPPPGGPDTINVNVNCGCAAQQPPVQPPPLQPPPAQPPPQQPPPQQPPPQQAPPQQAPPQQPLPLGGAPGFGGFAPPIGIGIAPPICAAPICCPHEFGLPGGFLYVGQFGNYIGIPLRPIVNSCF